MLKRRRDERGSVLALVPAGFLVLVALGALAVDNAASYLGQRQLHDTLAAAANDAASAGLSNRSFYRAGRLALDPGPAAVMACRAVAAQADAGLHGLTLWMSIDGMALTLRGSASVDAVFGRALPGVGSRRVTAAATAVAASGPLTATPRRPPSFTPLDCGLRP